MAISVEAIIARVLDIDPDRVVDDLEFQGILQWDSMHHVEMMVALEEAYGLEIDADTIVELTSVRAIRTWARLRGA